MTHKDIWQRQGGKEKKKHGVKDSSRAGAAPDICSPSPGRFLSRIPIHTCAMPTHLSDHFSKQKATCGLHLVLFKGAYIHIKFKTLYKVLSYDLSAGL